MTVFRSIFRPGFRRAAAVLPGLFLLAAPFAGQAAEVPTDSFKFDAGVGLGMSGYLGDANQNNLFAHPGFAATVSGRYLFADSRWALRAVFTTASLSGSTADMKGALPDAAVIDFKSQIYDLGFRGEANFFPYGYGETYKRLRRWTPYLALGAGVTLSSSGESSFAAFNIPMAVGIKYKLRPRLNLALEWSMTRTFGDHVDGPDLSDLFGIKRSFLKNCDWHSAVTVTLTYEFGRRCVTCHRID